MAVRFVKEPEPVRRSGPIVPQGSIEKAFLGDDACTERVRRTKLEAGAEPHDGGYAMRRGLVTGSLAEHELEEYATDRCFTVDLGRVVDQILRRTRLGELRSDRVAELRASAIEWVRRWQMGFPPKDGALDWSEVVSLMKPQTDLFVRRPGRFAIRVRPDNVFAVGTTIVAVEWSTARDPSNISPARFALNYHALLRERLRRPEWSEFACVATRVEMLALGEAFTVQLDAEQGESWRLKIASAVEAIIDGHYEKNVGPWCSVCPWQAPCWFGEQPVEGESF